MARRIPEYEHRGALGVTLGKSNKLIALQKRWTPVVGVGLWLAASPARAQSEELEVVVDPSVEREDAGVGRERIAGEAQRLRLGGVQSLGAFFADTAQLSVTAGNAGLGGASNKLSVAARGVNPRFSARTQWLFDGLPLAIAPYGRPQLTLFPLAMGWIDVVDLDLGGVMPFMGPHAIGGHLRLSLSDIVPGNQEQVQLRVDQFGQVQANLLMQMATEREQWVVGYATAQGSGYREHSEVSSHSALVRWRRRIGERHRLGAVALLHGEDTQIPGGLTPEQFEQDPRSSVRPLDRFTGIRALGGLFWDAVLAPGFVLSSKAVAGLTDRRSEVSTQTGVLALTAPLRVNPRRFHYLALESRLRASLGDLGPWPVRAVVEFGVAPALEWAQLRSEDRDPASGVRLTLRTRDRESISAMALHGRFLLLDRHRRWRWQAGVRAQWVGLSRQSQTSADFGDHHLFALLPSTQLQVRLQPRISLVAQYGQSHSPPQFLQISLAKDKGQLAPERGHSAHLGLDAQRLDRALGLKVVGFYKSIQDYADVSAQRLDQPGRLRALGLESQAFLRWPFFSGQGPRLEARLAHTWTQGRIVGGQLDRAQLPWVSPQRLRASVAFLQPAWSEFFLRGGLSYDAAQRTSYGADDRETPDGSAGRIPAWTSLWASLGLGDLRLGPKWQAQLSLRMDNLLDQRQYTRTPDRNAGRLLLSPRRLAFLLRLSRKEKTQAASAGGLGRLRFVTRR